jgi:hypothetical protein
MACFKVIPLHLITGTRKTHGKPTTGKRMRSESESSQNSKKGLLTTRAFFLLKLLAVYQNDWRSCTKSRREGFSLFRNTLHTVIVDISNSRLACHTGFFGLRRKDCLTRSTLSSDTRTSCTFPFTKAPRCLMLRKLQHTKRFLDFKGFWRWYMTFRTIGFLDFVHRPVF